MNFNIDSYKEKYRDIVLKNRQNFKFLSSCSSRLNYILGGGFPAGKIVEIYGHEGSGKSTLMYSTISCLKFEKNEFACIIDTEGGISSEEYLKSIGIDMSKVIIVNTSIAERVFDFICDLVSDKNCKLIILDSIATIITEEELDDNDSTLGVHARFVSKNVKRVVGIMNKCNSETCLVIVNQIRSKINDNWKGEMNYTTTGGKALKYYSSLRLEIERSEFISASEVRMGFYSKIKVTKSRFCVPFAVCIIPFLYSCGFCKEIEMIDLAIEKNLISKSGIWLVLKSGEHKHSFRNKIEMTNALKNDSELVKIIKTS